MNSCDIWNKTTTNIWTTYFCRLKLKLWLKWNGRLKKHCRQVLRQRRTVGDQDWTSDSSQRPGLKVRQQSETRIERQTSVRDQDWRSDSSRRPGLNVRQQSETRIEGQTAGNWTQINHFQTNEGHCRQVSVWQRVCHIISSWTGAAASLGWWWCCSMAHKYTR